MKSGTRSKSLRARDLPKKQILEGAVQRGKGRLQLQDESEDATWITVITVPNRKQHHHLSQIPFSGKGNLSFKS